MCVAYINQYQPQEMITPSHQLDLEEVEHKSDDLKIDTLFIHNIKIVHKMRCEMHLTHHRTCTIKTDLSMCFRNLLSYVLNIYAI